MSEKETKKERNWVMVVVLSVVLLVMPALSWIYLSKGFEWRKAAMAELQDYGKIRSAAVIYPDGTKENRLKDKVCVLHVFGETPDLTPANQRILDINEKLYEQFKESDAFRMVMIAEGGTAPFMSYMQKKPSVDFATSVYTGGVGSWSTILDNGYEAYRLKTGAGHTEAWYALADQSGTIRRYYNAMDDKEVERMVQQIAILLPK